MSLVTVIVPVYNMESLLPKCINSILGQTFRNIELIIVDDGSTDKTKEICDHYKIKDSRVKVFHKSNGGIGSAINVGLAEATGDYFLFVDSDDYIADKLIERLLELAINNDADIVQCGRYTFTNIEGIEIKEQIRGNLTVYQDNEEILNDFFHYRLITRNLAARIFKRELFQGVRCKEGHQVVDVVTLPVILQKCDKYIVTDERYYYAYERLDSVSRGALTKRTYDDFMSSLTFFKKFIEAYYPKHVDYLYFRNVTGAVDIYYSVTLDNNFENRDEVLVNCITIFKDNFQKFKTSAYYKEKNKVFKIYYNLFNFSPTLFVLVNRCRRFLLKKR